MDLATDEFAHVARDPFAKRALQFLAHDVADQIAQRLFIQDRVVGIPLITAATTICRWWRRADGMFPGFLGLDRNRLGFGFELRVAQDFSLVHGLAAWL